MAGCARIGQSVIDVKSGGRGRLSALSDPAADFSHDTTVFAAAIVGRRGVRVNLTKM